MSNDDSYAPRAGTIFGRMHLFVTGATGYVGRHVVALALARGHLVQGLVKDPSRVGALPPGVVPVLGTMDAPVGAQPAVAEAVSRCHAVVHTAFPSHGLTWADGVRAEGVFLRQVISLLEGTGKTLVVSNGSSFLGESVSGRHDETAPVRDLPSAVRARAVQPVTEAVGVRGVELRLASFVYGEAGSVFLPLLVEHARRTGHALYVGTGEARVSALHVHAAARAYLSSIENHEARGVFHVASEEEPSVRQIADAVAVASGARAVSVSLEEASRLLDPFTARFLSTDLRLDARRARRVLGFDHAGYDPLLWDVAHGSYASPGRGAGTGAVSHVTPT